MSFTKQLITQLTSWQFIRSALLYLLLGVSLAYGGVLATGGLFWIIVITVALIELNAEYK